MFWRKISCCYLRSNTNKQTNPRPYPLNSMLSEGLKCRFTVNSHYEAIKKSAYFDICNTLRFLIHIQSQLIQFFSFLNCMCLLIESFVSYTFSISSYYSKYSSSWNSGWSSGSYDAYAFASRCFFISSFSSGLSNSSVSWISLCNRSCILTNFL